MILRNTAIRHGRKALAAPLRLPQFRTLSTETSNLEASIDNHDNQTNSLDAAVNALQLTSKIKPPHKKKPRDRNVPNVAADFQTFNHIKKRTGKMGSVIPPHYEPFQLIVNPPSPKDVTLELLMASQSHLGHATQLWNPANQRYIYGIRQGVHIISLEETAAHLRRCAKVVEGVAYHGGLILFVGTRAGQDSAIVKAASLAQGCHLFNRWVAGSITNGDQILSKCALKAVDPLDKEVAGYDEKLMSWRPLKPDLVVCLNPLENYILLHECGLYNIPTIGVIDTDADPTWVTYPIPANDDSLRCIQLIAGVLGRAGEEGQRKRLEAAKNGITTWEPTEGLGEPVTEESKAREAALKAEAKRLEARR
ncbi:hypothetical protein SBOR_8017 [Sclerotinia borealis F-4128]|uniref:Uncharacterized protein n=1 Tax=Sclerotinia borealis (strain F-4128) TaxID=1432307 RepID=W9C497_SCLBF|nr:hypothetical protein SBOR_8017 [Sclerotinia borealis F-4128]